jgi:hypothetical protein
MRPATERNALASDRYTQQQLSDMARRLDECVEVSALCMDLALAGERHRRALANSRVPDADQGVDRDDATTSGRSESGPSQR